MMTKRGPTKKQVSVESNWEIGVESINSYGEVRCFWIVSNNSTYNVTRQILEIYCNINYYQLYIISA